MFDSSFFLCLDLPAQNCLRVEYLSMFKVHVTKSAGNWGFPDTYWKILNRDNVVSTTFIADLFCHFQQKYKAK